MTVSPSVRRATAVAVVAGAAVGAMALPASAAGHPAQHHRSVFISAVQYDSPGRDDGSNRSLNGEWVALTNDSRQAVNLDGWRLSDEDGRTYVFRHRRLAAGATVRVHSGVGRDTFSDVYQDRRTYVWDNEDTATLRDAWGRLVDSESWGRHARDHRRDVRDWMGSRDLRDWLGRGDQRSRPGRDHRHDGDHRNRPGDGDHRRDGDHRDRPGDGDHRTQPGGDDHRNRPGGPIPIDDRRHHGGDHPTVPGGDDHRTRPGDGDHRTQPGDDDHRNRPGGPIPIDDRRHHGGDHPTVPGGDDHRTRPGDGDHR
ncbi:lamin tail domain-containing protein, partial [Streptomyces tropicalis]|uniref:lamin tail domain-containing protein n=1 Tax=Streptomyces tropicalis TaxID=3034234 RepID=UPI003F68B444